MSDPAPLRYYGLPSGISDGKPPRLQLLTPKGLVREVPLDRSQLVKIIRAAANALEALDRDLTDQEKP